MLFRRYPLAEEGNLSRRLADLVRKETCADVAQAWNLGQFMRLGEGEILGGARKNKAILADACEAVIGAVFMDGGYEAARGLVERAFGERLLKPARPLRDAKTALQEWAQGEGYPTPTYSERGARGRTMRRSSSSRPRSPGSKTPKGAASRSGSRSRRRPRPSCDGSALERKPGRRECLTSTSRHAADSSR